MHLTLIISFLDAGGAERALTALANYWSGKGHQVSLVTLSSSEKKPFYPLHPTITLLPLNQMQSEKLSVFKQIHRIVRRILTLRRSLKHLKPDFIISFLDLVNITTLLASCGLKVPVIVAERTHPGFHCLPFLYQFLRKLTYRWADKIIVQTQGAAKYFSGALFNKTRVIPNAVSQPATLKNPRAFAKPARSLVSVGRLIPSKEFDTLIHAFAKILPHHPSLELTIYGEGPERQHLENLIRSLNLTQKVHLPGVTPHIYEALAKADLFVFPSRYEGFPNALCEAMSVGLPVIASHCSGNIDIVRDGIDGRLFPVGNEQALVDILGELLKDPEQRQRLSANALTITERFSEANIYQQWDALLHDIMI